VRFVWLDPPGSLCQTQAVRERFAGWRTAGHALDRIVEIGCGAGSLAAALLDDGPSALLVDASPGAALIAARRLAWRRAEGRAQVLCSELSGLPAELTGFDVALSMMTLEHVVDEREFLAGLCRLVRPGGWILVGVPARRDHWGVEDELVGHLRRYERADLTALLAAAGLVDVGAWSVAVPVANVLFRVGQWLVRRGTAGEVAAQGQRQQTATSGIRELPWKTVFPPAFRYLLNPRAMRPLFWLQRCFYAGDRGLCLLAWGRSGSMPVSSATR
jgi:SAM-dependent methyltransferase